MSDGVAVLRGKRKRGVDLVVMERNSNNDKMEVDGVMSVRSTTPLYTLLFREPTASAGGLVKAKGEVIKEHMRCSRRPPNMNCRIESFGRMCMKFDSRRKRWVNEMGFGGLLHLSSNMHLPRQLAYWVMTRIDPINKVLVAPDGREYKFSKNQVKWVLGIPKGKKVVPCSKNVTESVRMKMDKIMFDYGKKWETKSSRTCGTVYLSTGIPVNSFLLDRLEGYFEEHEEEEFKTLFLLVALVMVLCPTQSPRLATDLLPAVTCAMEAAEYDWCGLVLSKLMGSISNFARRFYASGFAGGCGGCAIFAVIFYLDRLNRDPLDWEVSPRLGVWTMCEIGKASKYDKLKSGDFGKLGLIDVAYGERHPREARDSDCPCVTLQFNDPQESVVGFTIKDRRRKTTGFRVSPKSMIGFS